MKCLFLNWTSIHSLFFQVSHEDGHIHLAKNIEVWFALEVMCVALAATHITEELLGDLEQTLSGISIDDVVGFVEIIYTFTGIHWKSALQLLMRMVGVRTVLS